CDPTTEWWQGKLFYEIFPASFQDSSKIGDGIGDLQGINSRINYLKSLGVKAVRLNSIFPSEHYPEHYSSIQSLTSIDENLGRAADFDELLQNLHRSGIKLILDVPVRYIPVPETLKQKSEVENSTGSKIVTPNFQRYVASPDNQVNVIYQVTAALKFWRSKNVDGFYLKDLEHHVNNNSNIADVLNLWRDLMEGDRILMCHWKVLEAAKSEDVKKALIQSMNLVDFTLNFGNGTLELKKQVDQVISSRIFQGINDEEVQSRPWIHWSTGGVDRRLIDNLVVKNASCAALIFSMMLPGTPSIFYGDEVTEKENYIDI
ncbi:GSCOCG00012820001-RA-CDS, partial [Cotesia congregata]